MLCFSHTTYAHIHLVFMYVCVCVCVNDLPALPHAKLAKKQLSHDRFFVELLHPYGECNLSICFKRESGKERAVSASLSSSQTSRHGMCRHECLYVCMYVVTRDIHTYVRMNARSTYVYTNLRTYVGFIYLCMRVCVCLPVHFI